MDHEARFAAVCEVAQAAMKRLHVPGVAIGIIDGPANAIHTAAFGVTNVETGVPVTTDTLFQIGSISKTFTGTLAMIMVEAGRLDLDVPIRTYLPDLTLADETVAANVTMRHLLNHTGGWVGDIFDDTGWGDDALARMVATLRDVPQLTPLGSVWSYNNAGFYIAGRALERITGMTFEAAMQKYVLDPLGMAGARYFPWDVIIERFAVGHDPIYETDGPTDQVPAIARPWYVTRNASAVGSLTSGVNDMLKYAAFHLGDGQTAGGVRLLSPKSMEALHTPTIMTDSAQNGVGITFYSSTKGNGKRTYGHGGATNGQKAQMHLCADIPGGFGLVILTNGDLGTALAVEVSEKAFALYLDVQRKAQTYRSLTEAEKAAVIGRYEIASTEIALRAEGDAIICQITDRGGFPKKDSPPPAVQPPPMTLRFYEGDGLYFDIADGPAKGGLGQVILDAHGHVEWLRLGGRIHRPLRA
jgi:CubicO group peptidase (beta-lactamase class C family)